MPAIEAKGHHGGFRSTIEASTWPRCSTLAGAGSSDFKVRGNAGACYILRNDVMTARWELTMFDRTGAIG